MIYRYLFALFFIKLLLFPKVHLAASIQEVSKENLMFAIHIYESVFRYLIIMPVIAIRDKSRVAFRSIMLSFKIFLLKNYLHIWYDTKILWYVLVYLFTFSCASSVCWYVYCYTERISIALLFICALYKTKNVDNFWSAHHEQMHIVSCFM